MYRLFACGAIALTPLLPSGCAFALNNDVTFPTAPDAIVLEYFLDIGGLANAIEDPEARVRLYGDGRAVVHVPIYMKRAGDYEVRLRTGALQDLLQSIAGSGLLEYEGNAMEERKRLTRATRATTVPEGESERTFRSDDATTLLRINLKTYRAPNGSETERNVSRTIVWHDAIGDSEEFTQIPEIARPLAAIQAVRQLFDHPGLKRIP